MGCAVDLGAAPFRAAAARRVIFVGGGGVTKMSAAASVGGVNQKLTVSKSCKQQV
jgi:hypothetical protein